MYEVGQEIEVKVSRTQSSWLTRTFAGYGGSADGSVYFYMKDSLGGNKGILLRAVCHRPVKDTVTCEIPKDVYARLVDRTNKFKQGQLLRLVRGEWPALGPVIFEDDIVKILDSKVEE